MFELTVSAEKAKEEYLNYLYDCLKNEIKKTDASVAWSEIDGRIFFSVACDAFKSAALSVAVAETLSEIFALGFKNEYLRQRLEISRDSLLSRTVLNTMTVLDSNVDRSIVKRALKGESKISLEGFFEFRLQELRDRWDEVIFLANNNSVMFADEAVVCDFLAFLIDAIPETVNILKIVRYGETIELFDNKGKQISVTRLLHGKQTTEERLIFNIICLSPKKVIIEDESLFSKEFNELIYKFF